MIVRLIGVSHFRPFFPRVLSPTREYRVLGIEGDRYRLLSGDGATDGPYLFNRHLFSRVDPTEPEDWISEFNEDWERFTRPPEFGPYTWDEYFEGNPAAAEKVRAYLERMSPCFWEVAREEDPRLAPGTRIDILRRLRLLALPNEQIKLKKYLKFDDMTEGLLLRVLDIVPRDLRSDEERSAVQQVAEFASHVWNDVTVDGVAPQIMEFVKMPQSAELAAAATEALRAFLPAGYQRYLGRPSDKTSLPPTAEDLQRARALAKTDCPRRYCDHWHSSTFDWRMPIAEGCTWLEEELPTVTGDSTPCCRCDPSAPRDHYEREAPYLTSDGFAKDHFG